MGQFGPGPAVSEGPGNRQRERGIPRCPTAVDPSCGAGAAPPGPSGAGGRAAAPPRPRSGSELHRAPGRPTCPPPRGRPLAARRGAPRRPRSLGRQRGRGQPRPRPHPRRCRRPIGCDRFASPLPPAFVHRPAPRCCCRAEPSGAEPNQALRPRRSEPPGMPLRG